MEDKKQVLREESGDAALDVTAAPATDATAPVENGGGAPDPAEAYFEKYDNATHRIGKTVSLVTLVLLLSAPFAIGAYLGAMPSLSAAAKGFLSIGLVWLVSSIAEYLIYTPMLGAGGSYLAFITGNLLNMKIPCAMNAKDLVGAKSGTKENEIISTLSIATSSLVTILVLALGVALLAPLQPILQSPTLQPAFDSVVPALFGAMAYKYFRGHMNIAVYPLVIMSVLFILLPSLVANTSMMIIPSGAIAIFIAYRLWKKANGKDDDGAAVSAAAADAGTADTTADATETPAGEAPADLATADAETPAGKGTADVATADVETPAGEGPADAGTVDAGPADESAPTTPKTTESEKTE